MCLKKSYWVSIWNKWGKVTGGQGRVLNGKLSIFLLFRKLCLVLISRTVRPNTRRGVRCLQILAGNLFVGFEIILKRFKKIIFEIWFHLDLDGIRLHYLEKIRMNLRDCIYSINIFIRWETVSFAQRSYTIKLFTGITFRGVSYKEWKEQRRS